MMIYENGRERKECVMISIRISQGLKNWLFAQGLSQSKVFKNACKKLGWKE